MIYIAFINFCVGFMVYDIVRVFVFGYFPQLYFNIIYLILN